MPNPEHKHHLNHHEKHSRAQEIVDWMSPSVKNPQKYEFNLVGETVRVTKTTEKNPDENNGLMRVTGERLITKDTFEKIDKYIKDILPEIDHDKDKYFKISRAMQNVNKARRLLLGNEIVETI